MACPLLAPSRMAVSRCRPSPVPSPVPTVVEIHIADGWAPSCRDLCPSPFPSLDPDHGPSRGLAVGRRVDVCEMRGPVHLASYLTPAKADVCS